MTRKEKITALQLIADRLNRFFSYNITGQEILRGKAWHEFCGLRTLLYATHSNAMEIIAEIMYKIQHNEVLLPYQIAEYADKLKK